MKTIKLTIATLITISGLMLAGAETEPFSKQVICSTAGVILFAIGGLLVAVTCKKNNNSGV